MGITTPGKARTLRRSRIRPGHRCGSGSAGGGLRFPKTKPLRELFDRRINEWGKAIRKRDNNRCQNPQCRTNYCMGGMVAHHIQYRSQRIDLRYDIDNGIFLCANCHDAAHKGTTMTNSERISGREFVRRILENIGWEGVMP